MKDVLTEHPEVQIKIIHPYPVMTVGEILKCPDTYIQKEKI